MVALSCWADLSDRSEGMLTWQTASVIGVEKRLNLVSGLTAVIDETRLVKDPALVDSVVREAAQDRLRVLLAQAEIVRSLGASLRTAYELAGTTG
jgi:hypothetical protein